MIISLDRQQEDTDNIKDKLMKIRQQWRIIAIINNEIMNWSSYKRIPAKV